MTESRSVSCLWQWFHGAKAQQIVHFKWMPFVVYKLYFNKADLQRQGASLESHQMEGEPLFHGEGRERGQGIDSSRSIHR